MNDLIRLKEFKIMTISSLEKLLPDKTPELAETENTCFTNEVFNYQIAYYSDNLLMLQDCRWEIVSDIVSFIKIRPVKLIPCTTPVFEDADDYYLVKKPALIPELLVEENAFHPGCKIWQSLFVTIKGDLPVGKHEIIVKLKDETGNELGSCTYNLTVLDGVLPETELKYTRWFHYDSLSSYYGVDVFSDDYMTIMSNYIKNAVAHGINMLYVPLFTSPTNTRIGRERLTVQLIDVTYENGVYSFDFSRLKEFLRLLLDLGVRYFEFSHLYTQWGAAAAPKIIVKENGQIIKKFGWDTPALGKEYKKFISSFLPALIDFLKENGYNENMCFFHISDEPSENTLEHYLEINRFIKPMLGPYKVMDALSDFDFYKIGAVDIPVVTTDHIKPFIDAGVEEMMVYYCCSQGHSGLSNSFIAMPLFRTRVLGIQLYTVDSKGLLQWGYNYYNSALSEEFIDPFFVTDACGNFQSGDSFIVYPDKNGKPLDSIRHEVLFDALQDYAALKLLEKKIGRDNVLGFIYGFGVKPNFSDYPKNAGWLIEFRKELNDLIVD
ncbi:MAG: DUF4091 domain-containing protein [Clostridia bacterium]|nr:DUF4091 domain-containing protein [Clostridia bacterium]